MRTRSVGAGPDVGSIKVYGTPVPKGSMECLGPRGKGGRHLVVDSRRKELEGPQGWQDKITAAGRALLTKLGAPMNGAVTVSVTFTFERPKTVKQPYPITRSSGDLDKLLRAVLDGLTASGVFADDSRVINAEPWKCYPDSPGIPDRLDRPGALIRIETL